MNYRPISNLPFLGKILEKAVYQQLHVYLSHNNFFDVYQSGFRINHSTKTALLRVVNDLKINSDNHIVTVLVLLHHLTQWIILYSSNVLNTVWDLEALFLTGFPRTLLVDHFLLLLVTVSQTLSVFCMESLNSGPFAVQSIYVSTWVHHQTIQHILSVLC